MKALLLSFCAAIGTLAWLFPFRASAIDLLVYNLNNAGRGSLRQAIHDNNALGGGNTILFWSNVSGTITLAEELIISKSVTIAGPGPEVITVSGNSAGRVFNIPSGSVVISGLTITRANSFAPGGGGIHNLATLQVSNCLFTLNYGVTGGGIFNQGTQHLANCVFTTNTSILGGGIYNVGELTLSDCLFSANGAYDGGAIFGTANLAANRCAFVNNGVGRHGGALFLTNSSVATLVNSTIASNTASTGGGIYNEGGLILTSCTIATNIATLAGGLFGPATVRNTIIARNGFANGVDGYDDVSGACISQGYNLIGVTNGSTGWGAVGDQGGWVNNPLDPYLYPPGFYGSSTPTMPPAFPSPALDQGKSFGLTTDQRGRTRPATNQFIISIPSGGDRSDIGAAEMSPMTLLVMNTNDAGPGSLRGEILNASLADNDTVAFAPNVTNRITLTSGELIVNKNLTIAGPGAHLLTISGGNANRVFNLISAEINLSGLTIANGLAVSEGGGIRVASGRYTISDCHIVSNAVTGFYSVGGGVLATSNAILSLLSCSVTYNQAGFAGGGIGGGIFGGESLAVGLYNCTIAGNRVTDTPETFYWPSGGGVWRGPGFLDITGCTISSNSSTYYSGGVDNLGYAAGTAYLRTSIVAGNSAPNVAPDAGGLFASGGYNLIGSSIGNLGFTNTGDQLNLDPLLGPLANYGGPTPSMALRAGSPAIDKGQTSGFGLDQRGFPRHLDDLTIANASDGTDIGAFEVDPNFRIVELRRAGTDIALSLMTMLGRNYRVEYTNDMTAGSWPMFTNNIPGNGWLLWVTNYDGANQARRFYRGAVVP